MAPNPDLSPPGTSSYSSGTLNVGDGTWDSSRNIFLLPNLVGLNFDTMRYNGMGNRFASFDGYHSLIVAHGTLAAITFLAVIPAAILFKRFYHRNPYQALRIHVMLQSLTLALIITIFILGYMAVGPTRSLTNPHHGIGVAIFTLILVQALGGWFVKHRAKGRILIRPTLTAELHHWNGRLIALLGIIQIALGLTLYGSPKYLFILYAFAVAILVLVYFFISWRSSGPPTDIYNENGQIIIEREGEERSHRWRNLAAAAGVGAGVAALASRRRRSSSRSRSRSRSRSPGRSRLGFGSRLDRGSRPPTVVSDGHGSYISDEKSGYYKQRTSWKDRLLGLGAAAGAGGLAAKLLRRNRNEQFVVDPPARPQQSVMTATEDYSVVQQTSPGGTPLRRPPGVLHNRNDSYTSYSSYSDSPEKKRRFGWKEGILGLGGIVGLRELYKNRQAKKEQRRADEIRAQDIREEEEMSRVDSQRHHRFTGDGVPLGSRIGDHDPLDPRTGPGTELPPPPRFGGYNDGTELTGSSFSAGQEHRSRLGMNDVAATVAAAAAAENAEEAARYRREEDERLRAQAMPSLAPPSAPALHHAHAASVMSPSSASSWSASDERDHTSRHHSGIGSSVGAAVAAGAAGAVIGSAISRHRSRSRSRSEDRRRMEHEETHIDERHSTADSTAVDNPVVSMNVRHNPDGRTVTINRNPEQERPQRQEQRRLQRAQTAAAASAAGMSGSSLAAGPSGYTSPTRLPPTATLANPGSAHNTPPSYRPYNSPSNVPSNAPYQHYNAYGSNPPSRSRLASPHAASRLASPNNPSAMSPGVLSPAGSAAVLRPPPPIAGSGYASPGSSPGSVRPSTAGTGMTGGRDEYLARREERNKKRAETNKLRAKQ